MCYPDGDFLVGSGDVCLGQVEIAGLDAPPNWRRAQMLRAHLQGMFPGLARELPPERVRYWMGHRPSLADGLPCIGPATRCADIIHAFGHGHVGLVGSARTGRLVAQVLTGVETEIGLEAYSARRFA
jgi:D-amino-acid dehydrogenase